MQEVTNVSSSSKKNKLLLKKKKPGRRPKNSRVKRQPYVTEEETFIRRHCELTKSALPVFERLGYTGYSLTYKQFKTAAQETSLYKSKLVCIKKLYKFILLCDSFFTKEQKAKLRHLKQKYHEPLMEARETIDPGLAFYEGKIRCGEFVHIEHHPEEGMAVMRCLNAYFLHLLQKDIEHIQHQLEEEEKAVLDSF